MDIEGGAKASLANTAHYGKGKGKGTLAMWLRRWGRARNVVFCALFVVAVTAFGLLLFWGSDAFSSSPQEHNMPSAAGDVVVADLPLSQRSLDDQLKRRQRRKASQPAQTQHIAKQVVDDGASPSADADICSEILFDNHALDGKAAVPLVHNNLTVERVARAG